MEQPPAESATGKVFFDVRIGKRDFGRIIMELDFVNTPKTAENFRALCTGEKGMGSQGKALHYKGCKFHRVIPMFMAQGGDIVNENGTGSDSIYGKKFKDENFLGRHTGRGILSMANCGPNSNACQFFILFKEMPHLDGKHVVFGQVVDGMDVLDALEAAGSNSGKTSQSCIIADCGELSANFD